MPRKDPGRALAIRHLLGVAEAQGGVVRADQALEVGMSRSGIRSLVESGAWRSLHRGVFLVEGQPLDLPARMWGAHLALGPSSVIGGTTAGRAWTLLDPAIPVRESISVVMPDSASRAARGVVIRRLPDPQSLVHPTRRPPILSVEHTVIELFIRTDDLGDATELVLRAFRAGLTTPDRLWAAAERRARIRGRSTLGSLCATGSRGATSPLEHEYLTRVAGAHGLPPARGQAPDRVFGRRAYRDLRYEPWGVIVELDGQRGHADERGTFRDQFRDNAATLSGAATLRFGWIAVMGRACLTAEQVGGLLQQRGWAGAPGRCGRGCQLGSLGLLRAA